MKRPHRRTHFIIWLILTPVIAVAAFAIYQQRPPDPVADLDAIPQSAID